MKTKQDLSYNCKRRIAAFSCGESVLNSSEVNWQETFDSIRDKADSIFFKLVIRSCTGGHDTEWFWNDNRFIAFRFFLSCPPRPQVVALRLGGRGGGGFLKNQAVLTPREMTSLLSSRRGFYQDRPHPPGPRPLERYGHLSEVRSLFFFPKMCKCVTNLEPTKLTREEAQRNGPDKLW